MVPVHQLSTIAELLKVVARYHGDKIGLIVDDQSATYRELDERSTRVAGALVRESIAEGDRIAILGRDSIASLLALFGAAKVKAVCVPVNLKLSPEEIRNILVDARPKLVFADPDVAAALLPALRGLPSPPRLVTLAPSSLDAQHFETWVGGASELPSSLSYGPDDVVVQLYTSGTTGQPKGVLLANRSFFAVPHALAEASDAWMGWSENDVNLLFIPTFHIGGLWGLIRGLGLGSSNIVLKGFDPGRILEMIPRHRVTMMGMVPAMMQVLLAEPDCQTTDFSSLERILYGAAPISPALLDRARAVFQCGFCQIYGLTETGNLAVTLRPDEHFTASPDRLLAAGRPAPGVGVRIVMRDGRPAQVREVGEIAIRSAAQMVGYHNLPEATRSTIVDGWIMTGDGGYLDEQGYLYVCDRIKDMIISAGENIYPAEIENAIRTHESVADAAVIGVPDELWGEAVLAFVVPRAGAELKAPEIIKHIRGRIAEFKIPRTVEFLDKLPRTASGKVKKSELRKPYWQGRARNVN